MGEGADAGVDLSATKTIIAMHRVREVSCRYGFSRLEAAPTSVGGELEDVEVASKELAD